MRTLHTTLTNVFRFAPAVIVCATLLPTATICRADSPAFKPARIDSFDGKSWTGITLGVTSQDGIKKQFRNSRGDYPTSVLLEMDKQKDQPFRVTALYPNKDKEAKLQGIVIRYTDPFHGLPLDKLQMSLGGPGSAFYTTTRYEDWMVISYPDKGIILFSVGGQVPLVLLGSPERIAPTTALLSTTPGDLGNYGDQFRNVQHILKYQNISVGFSLSKIRLDDENRARRFLTDDAAQVSQRNDLLHFDPQSNYGTYDISISANYDPNKGGSGTSTVSISGNGPFGKLSSVKSINFNIDSGPGDLRLEDTEALRATQRAMRMAEHDLAAKVANQQPPPIESVRISDTEHIIDTYRFHIADASHSLLN